MQAARSLMRDKPWAGWAVAGLALAAAVFFFIRNQSANQGYSTPDRMQEMVTIKFMDTGDEETMPRGRLDKLLRSQQGTLDPEKGLINPKTNQPTGFPIDKDDWAAMIARINADRAQFGGGLPSAGKGAAPVGRPGDPVNPLGAPPKQPPTP
jgi:hypothetical protein